MLTRIDIFLFPFLVVSDLSFRCYNIFSRSIIAVFEMVMTHISTMFEFLFVRGFWNPRVVLIVLY